ncbi:peptidase inhibitor 16 [Hoplias malabaricus]|uniref:peptidase inhibitor 16 n=1 Tax=Hoplias malabaricus TaxID=27720 RepID=UPI00346351E6
MALKWTLFFAGFWMLMALVNSQLSEDQKRQILQSHNIYRSQVNPPAADMISLVWGEELSLVAKAYSAKCIWDHNPDLQKNEMGENLFISTGAFKLEKALSDWFEERTDYDYDNNTCPEDKMCGHYTQMVWAKTTRVGCEVHFCQTVESLDFKNASLLVCNYSPAGNVIGLKPYEKGAACSKCPEKLKDCVLDACADTERHISPSVDTLATTWSESPSTLEEAGSGSRLAAPLLLTGLLSFLHWI